MNDSQRKIVALALVVVGVLCLVKTYGAVHTPPVEILGVKVSARDAWDRAPMGWVIGGVVAFAAAGLVAASGRKG
jgi:hypothetical protein